MLDLCWMTLLFTILAALVLPNWVQHESIDGGFVVQVPQALETSLKGIETEVGTLEYHSHSLRTENDSLGHAFFAVSYCDYPDGSFPSDSVSLIKEFLDVTMEQGTSAIEGTLVYSDQISIDDHPGRFWRIHYDEDRSVLKTRAFLVGDRFYTVQIAVRNTHAQEDFVDRFLESFRLLE